jgi:hypothetical protein
MTLPAKEEGKYVAETIRRRSGLTAPIAQGSIPFPPRSFQHRSTIRRDMFLSRVVRAKPRDCAFWKIRASPTGIFIRIFGVFLGVRRPGIKVPVVNTRRVWSANRGSCGRALQSSSKSGSSGYELKEGEFNHSELSLGRAIRRPWVDKSNLILRIRQCNKVLMSVDMTLSSGYGDFD